MRAPLTLSLLALLAAAPAFAEKSEDEAGDTSEVDKDATGPLRDRIRPVSGHLFLMDGRFEVSPGVGISVRDAFFTKILLGGALTYHFTEQVALSVRGAYAVDIISGTAQICVPATQTTAASCRLPTFDELTTDRSGAKVNKAWGLMTLLASLDLQWAPIYGKFSLISEKFLSFNMYGLIGPALVLYGPTNVITAGGNVGLGFRFFFNRFMTLRLELRDTIYNEVGDRAGTTVNSVRNQLNLELGLSFFLPTSFGEQR